MGFGNDYSRYTNSLALLLGRIRMVWRRERAVGVHEAAREGWLGAVVGRRGLGRRSGALGEGWGGGGGLGRTEGGALDA